MNINFTDFINLIENTGNMRITKDTDYIDFQYLGGSMIGAQTSIQIDVSDLDYIKIKCDSRSPSYNNYATPRFSPILILQKQYNPITTYIANYGISSVTGETYKIDVQGESKSFVVDVSSLSGYYYLTLCSYGASSNWHDLEIIETPIQYYVTFNPNGGDGNSYTQTILYDEITALETNRFTKENYVFLGWSSSPLGQVEYVNGENVYNIAEPNETINLYAIWQEGQLVVSFYYNASDERQIFKELLFGDDFNGRLRDDSSIINPVIMFTQDEVFKYNYCYIPRFQRYYFVRDITSYRNKLWIVTMETDVLMSFKNDIANFEVVVDKQTMDENGDEYIDDGSLVSDNYMFNRVYNFAHGFNENPTYILICAG